MEFLAEAGPEDCPAESTAVGWGEGGLGLCFDEDVQAAGGGFGGEGDEGVFMHRLLS